MKVGLGCTRGATWRRTWKTYMGIEASSICRLKGAVADSGLTKEMLFTERTNDVPLFEGLEAASHTRIKGKEREGDRTEDDRREMPTPARNLYATVEQCIR